MDPRDVLEQRLAEARAQCSAVIPATDDLRVARGPSSDDDDEHDPEGSTLSRT